MAISRPFALAVFGPGLLVAGLASFGTIPSSPDGTGSPPFDLSTVPALPLTCDAEREAHTWDGPTVTTEGEPYASRFGGNRTCTRVFGTVLGVNTGAGDGDLAFDVDPSGWPGQEWLGTKLHLEVVCFNDPAPEADPSAVLEFALASIACQDYREAELVEAPCTGQVIEAVGTYVIDVNHDKDELHPLSAFRVVSDPVGGVDDDCPDPS